MLCGILLGWLKHFFMSPHIQGVEHTDFGADFLGVGIGVTLSSLHNILNQKLDSYQIFMYILLGHNKEQIKFW